MPGTTLNDLDSMDVETLFPYIDYLLNKDNPKKGQKVPKWYKEAMQDKGNQV